MAATARTARTWRLMAAGESFPTGNSTKNARLCGNFAFCHSVPRPGPLPGKGP